MKFKFLEEKYFLFILFFRGSIGIHFIRQTNILIIISILFPENLQFCLLHDKLKLSKHFQINIEGCTMLVCLAIPP